MKINLNHVLKKKKNDMGLKIPKIPKMPKFRIPKPRVPVNSIERDEDLDLVKKTLWVSVQDRLLMDRVIFLSGIIKKSTANRIFAVMFFLNADNDDIVMYINSPGGEARSAITIYDTMNTVVANVYTIVTGLAASSASLILSGGTMGSRVALPNARIMIHQPVAGPFSGSPHILASEAERMLELRNTIASIYAKNTDKPLSVIQKDLEREKYMSATEAQAYGIIDHVTLPGGIKRAPEEEERKQGDFDPAKYKSGNF